MTSVKRFWSRWWERYSPAPAEKERSSAGGRKEGKKFINSLSNENSRSVFQFQNVPYSFVRLMESDLSLIELVGEDD